MEILGKTIIFSEVRSGFTFFRASISSKLGDEGNGKNKQPKYASLSLDIRFVGDKYNSKKCREKFNSIGENKHIAIEIKKGFISIEEFQSNNGEVKRKLVLNVQDCEFDKGGWINNEKSAKAPAKASKAKSKTTSTEDNQDDDMPFWLTKETN